MTVTLSRTSAGSPGQPMDGRSELLQLFASHRPALRRAFYFSLVAGVLVLAPSVYMLEVYARVVDSRNHLTLLMLTLAVALAFVVMELLEWVRSGVLHAVGEEVDTSLSPRLFDLTFEANLKRLPGGSLLAFQDWRTVREFLHSPFVLALMEAPVALLYLVLVYLISPVLGWVTLASAVVQVGVAWMTERKTQPPLTAANRKAHAAQQYADGSLRNAEVIEAMGMLRHIHARWMTRQREFLGLQAEASRLAGAFQATSKLIQQVLSSGLLGLSAWLLLQNSLNGGPGMMIVASIIGARVLTPLVQMVTQWRQVVNARDAWARLCAILSAVPARQPAMPLPRPKGVLTVEQLTAGAPTPPGVPSAPILRGVQFAAQPGEIVAVIGPSASGKTTLARLLVGLWPAMAGKVRLDGADVYTWNKSELGPSVGYLPQGIELFEGTLGQNIARFGPVDLEKVSAAAHLVGLQALVEALPHGHDTLIGREGAVLSGGQRQRVALARALYGDPSLVVLDEPNSSLDEAGDLALAEALRQVRARGATVVVMTHRAGLLGLSDKILLLVEGTQQAFGPRDEVLAAMQQARAKAAGSAASAAPSQSAVLARPAVAPGGRS